MLKHFWNVVLALVVLVSCCEFANAQFPGRVEFRRVTLMGPRAIRGQANSRGHGHATFWIEPWQTDEDDADPPGEHEFELDLEVDNVWGFDFLFDRIEAEGTVDNHSLHARIETSEENPLHRENVEEEDIVSGIIDRAYLERPAEMRAWTAGPSDVDLGFKIAGAGITGNVDTDYALEVIAPAAATKMFVQTTFDIKVDGDLVKKLNSAYLERTVAGSFIGASWDGNSWTIIGLIRQDEMDGVKKPAFIFEVRENPNLDIQEFSRQLLTPTSTFGVHQKSRYDVSASAGNLAPGPLEQSASFQFLNQVDIRGFHDG